MIFANFFTEKVRVTTCESLNLCAFSSPSEMKIYMKCINFQKTSSSSAARRNDAKLTLTKLQNGRKKEVFSMFFVFNF